MAKGTVKFLRMVDENSAHNLKITSFGKDMLTYYSSMRGGYWDIIGFRILPDENITIRLMHFEDEFLDDEDFAAEQHGSPFFSFDVSECRQFLLFIKQTILQKEVIPRSVRQHFQMLNAPELRELHYSGTEVERWYRYTEKTASKENEKISLIGLPTWYKKYGMHQGNALWFITLDKSHLENDHFELIRNCDGLGTITLTREALEALVIILSEKLRDLD